DRLNALDPAVDAYLGSSVAIDGQFILTGANNRATPAGVGAGVVYGYTPVNGVWTEVSRFTPLDSAPNGKFGGAVGLGGQAQWAVIGAWGVNSGAGEGYIFQRNTATNAWNQVAFYTPG